MFDIKRSSAEEVLVFLEDEANPRDGLTGVAYGDVTAYKTRSGQSASQITTTGTGTRRETDGYWHEIDSTNMPGWYGLTIAFDASDGEFGYEVSASGAYRYRDKYKIVEARPEDVYNRTGAPAGASLAADVAAVKSDTGSIKTNVDTNLDASMSSRAPAATALSTATWTGTRASYLDLLNAYLDGPISGRASQASLDVVDGVVDAIAANFGNGNLAQTFTVTDSGSESPLEGALITVTDTEGGVVCGPLATNSFGQRVIPLAAGDYLYQVSRSGSHQPLVDQELAVAEAAAIPVELEPIPETAPASSDFCQVYGSATMPTGEAYPSGSLIYVELSHAVRVAGTAVGKAPRKVTIGADKSWNHDIPKQSSVTHDPEPGETAVDPSEISVIYTWPDKTKTRKALPTGTTTSYADMEDA